MKYLMKKKTTEKFQLRIFSLILLILSFGFFVPVFGQEETTDNTDKQPARPAFESALLIDAQSVVVPSKGTLEFDMQHRFGSVENGIKDFYGIYAPGANIRLGFTYSPIENLSIGFGYAKLKNYLDFSAKYSILKQRKDWSIPVSLTYYGNMAADTRDVQTYDKPVHRFSFHNELIIAARITPKISLQVTPSFSHFNAVDSVKNSNTIGVYNNDIIAVTLAGRYKFSAQSSILFSYTQQLTGHDDLNAVGPNGVGSKLQPGFSLGWEIATSAHAFQIFITNFQRIIPQENMVFNENDFLEGDLLIGFNITRLWNF